MGPVYKEKCMFPFFVFWGEVGVGEWGVGRMYIFQNFTTLSDTTITNSSKSKLLQQYKQKGQSHQKTKKAQKNKQSSTTVSSAGSLWNFFLPSFALESGVNNFSLYRKAATAPTTWKPNKWEFCSNCSMQKLNKTSKCRSYSCLWRLCDRFWGLEAGGKKPRGRSCQTSLHKPNFTQMFCGTQLKCYTLKLLPEVSQKSYM